MYSRRPSATLFFVVLVLLAGLLAGCGGREDQSGNGSQDGSGGAEKQGGKDSKQGVSATKIALGRVVRVDPEAGRIILRPSTEEQGKKPLRFKVREDATITLDDEEAELSDAENGQQAQISYIVRNERKVAREVALISSGGAGSRDGEETG